MGTPKNKVFSFKCIGKLALTNRFNSNNWVAGFFLYIYDYHHSLPERGCLKRVKHLVLLFNSNFNLGARGLKQIA